jgi:hypothetical protein
MQRSPGARSPLDEFLDARSKLLTSAPHEDTRVDSRQADAVKALLTAHPVHRPLTPVIGGRRVLADSSGPGFDVEATVCRIAGDRAFYLTGVTTGGSYYWAFADSRRRWTAGHERIAEHDEGGRALRSLFAALPVRQTGRVRCCVRD